MKSQLYKVVICLWIVIGSLSLSSQIFTSPHLRPVKLLCDITKDSDSTVNEDFQNAIDNDNISNDLTEELASIDYLEENDNYKDDNKPEIIAANKKEISYSWNTECIIDYSQNGDNMKSLYKKLQKSYTNKNIVRIGILSDSYFTSDAFSAFLRNKLQNKYGGIGIGHISISPTNKKGFRPPIYHLVDGWSIRKKSECDHYDAGIEGYSFVPIKPDAETYVYGLPGYFSKLSECDIFSLFFSNSSAIRLAISVNGNEEVLYDIAAAKGLNKLSINGNIENVRWRLVEGKDVTFYNMAMEPKNGICVDDITNEGTNGSYIASLNDSYLKEYDKMRPYDFIILQYGNSLNEKTDLIKYHKMMSNTISHLKKNMPNTKILLLSAGVLRETRKQGKFISANTDKIIECQNSIAKDNKIAFWNMNYNLQKNKILTEKTKSSMLVKYLGKTRIKHKGSSQLGLIFAEKLNEENTIYK